MEARITKRTAVRSELFRRLEDELNKLTTAPLVGNASMEIEEKAPPYTSIVDGIMEANGAHALISSQVQKAVSPSVEDEDDGFCDEQESKGALQEFRPDNEDDHLDTGNRGAFSTNSRSMSHSGLVDNCDTNAVPLSSGDRLAKLRSQALEIDELLQADRSLLAMLRIAQTRDLARLERLETETCRHSEQWEIEEQTRLSAGIEISRTTEKRKRDIQDDDGPSEKSKSQKVMIRALETLVALGVGVGLASVKQTYFS